MNSLRNFWLKMALKISNYIGIFLPLSWYIYSWSEKYVVFRNTKHCSCQCGQVFRKPALKPLSLHNVWTAHRSGIVLARNCLLIKWLSSCCCSELDRMVVISRNVSEGIVYISEEESNLGMKGRMQSLVQFSALYDAWSTVMWLCCSECP